MQRRAAQGRRGVQQEIPFELMPRFKPVIHSPQRLLHHHPVLRVDEALLHGGAQRHECRLDGQVLAHRQGGQEGFGQVHQRVLQGACAE
ncbi:hypothetical protein D3C78_1625740 [compost metagenome]